MTWFADHSWLLAAALWVLLIGGSWGSLGYGWLRDRRRRHKEDDQ